MASVSSFVASKSSVVEKFSNDEVKNDFYLAHLSREISIIGRREVLSGKASFGIFGEGKEVAQIALAKTFKEGDWRSGYYRDQTFMFATGMSTPEEFFAMLYGDTNLDNNPSNAGRNFNNHFGTRYLDDQGNWLATSKMKNSASDISPTAGQMPRLLGLAYASKVFRKLEDFTDRRKFSNDGNEVAFGTIGDASTSEGHFWEVLNAAAVLQVPLVMAVWDDGYGISVPTEMQTVKASIYEALKGFEKKEGTNGIYLYQVKGWDYPSLCQVFAEGVDRCRKEHIPVVFHVTELTQPQGHSTSGSHERYKSPERLAWEQEHDPLVKMREWILASNIATSEELDEIQAKAIADALAFKNKAYRNYINPIVAEKNELLQIATSKNCNCKGDSNEEFNAAIENLRGYDTPGRKDVISIGRRLIRSMCIDCPNMPQLKQWLQKKQLQNLDRYSSHLYCENEKSALHVEIIPPVFSDNQEMAYGRDILRDNFDVLFSRYPNLIAIGEDIGKIGGVNQTYEGLQQKYGEHRITDTSIREASIVGQGIGMAMRGLRVIAEIQYLDYLLYSLQTLSDDLATLRWRTYSGQAAPLVISTRGHRLVGVWHAGSPMGMIIHALRGVYVCVPRNMTQAAGFYNTLLKGQDPGLVIEPLNGYRLKELRPTNIGQYTVPLGVSEILTTGNDVTLVTYGSMVRIAQEAVEKLKQMGISVELIDVQTLLPFDIHHIIAGSVKKTGRLLLTDEDVPGGATAFMLQQIVEVQDAWKYLKQPPRTLTGAEHRPAYASDGDYFSKPSSDDIIDTIIEMF
ncbi:MAG: thiamine pyrophosphate-dependent enzyme [Bacteroidales bacterium]|nr:thiamine pyrophosphate-dependent enzyme [Bacteroidales bacterium]